MTLPVSSRSYQMLHGTKRLYKAMKTWNEFQIPKLNLFELDQKLKPLCNKNLQICNVDIYLSLVKSHPLFKALFCF